MTKKYGIDEIESSIRLAGSATPSCFSEHKRYHEMAIKFHTDAVKEAEMLRTENLDAASYQQWQELLCMANFGLGFGKGLLDMKNKTYRNKNRSFSELASLIKGFEDACSRIKLEPLVPHNHLNLGTSYGSLGLAKEGKKMLETSTYWDNIRDYIENDNSLR